MRRGREKKACAGFVTSQYVQNRFPPPQTGCPQHARATAAERCKNTKHVSVCITCHLNHGRKGCKQGLQRAIVSKVWFLSREKKKKGNELCFAETLKSKEDW